MGHNSPPATDIFIVISLFFGLLIAFYIGVYDFKSPLMGGILAMLFVVGFLVGELIIILRT